MRTRTRVLRLSVVAFVVTGLGCCATAAQASNWVAGLAGAAKQAQAHSDTAPTVPTGVAVVCVASNQKLLRVSWNSVAHATYDIFVSTTSPNSGFSSAATGVAGTSWTSAALANGTFWYQVAAVVGSNWRTANSAAPASHVIQNANPKCT